MTRDEARVALGAYVIGALAPEERAEVDRWLAADPALREELAGLAGIPGLLGRLDEDEVGAERASGASLEADRVVAEAGRERYRSRRRLRRWQAFAGVAATAAVALGAVAIVSAMTASPTVVAAAPSAVGPPVEVAVIDPAAVASGLTGVVQANPRGWGAEVKVSLWDLPAERTQFRMVVVARDGRQEQAAAWRSTASGQCLVTGATSILAADIARIEILSDADPVLAQADLL